MGNFFDTASLFDESVQVDAVTQLERDPRAAVESATKRYIVWAIHPSSNERLRGEVLRTNVPIPDKDGDDTLERGREVRWGRYWLKESGSTDILPEASIEKAEDFRESPATLFAHYLSFVQMVGSPCFDYEKDESVFLRDKVDRWHNARIIGKTKHYYLFEYEDSPETTSEWIHRFSTRIRKKTSSGPKKKKKKKEKPWETVFELDWIRVRHPTLNMYLPAKVIMRDEEEETLLVQYEDAHLPQRQEVITRKHLEEPPPSDPAQNVEEMKVLPKIENYDNYDKRWRYNRIFIYSGALKVMGLRIHPISGANGHSLFRALSHQLFGSVENFTFVRAKCWEHIVSHKEYFANFVDVNFEYYIAHKKKGLDVEGEYFAMGDHLDIQAVCERFDVRVEIYSELSPLPLETIRFYHQMTELPVIRLSYRGQNHYDSVEHVDEPLPIKVMDGGRLAPIGAVPSKAKIIQTARENLWQTTIPKKKVTEKTIVSEDIDVSLLQVQQVYQQLVWIMKEFDAKIVQKRTLEVVKDKGGKEKEKMWVIEDLGNRLLDADETEEGVKAPSVNYLIRSANGLMNIEYPVLPMQPVGKGVNKGSQRYFLRVTAPEVSVKHIVRVMQTKLADIGKVQRRRLTIQTVRPNDAR